MSRTIHACLSVRGALRWPNKLLKGLLIDESGKHMTAAAAREALMDELAKGHEVLPMGDPCDGFDFKTGCPGHHHEAAATEPAQRPAPTTEGKP